jgi:hypothetical protein
MEWESPHFHEYIAHHAVATSLIAASYAFGGLRCGTIVLASQDFVDIWYYSWRVLHRLRVPVLADSSLIAFALFFYIFRLVLLPRWIYAATAESVIHFVRYTDYAQWRCTFEASVILPVLVYTPLLSALLLLYCYWFVGVLKVIYETILKKCIVSA